LMPTKAAFRNSRRHAGRRIDPAARRNCQVLATCGDHLAARISTHGRSATRDQGPMSASSPLASVAEHRRRKKEQVADEALDDRHSKRAASPAHDRRVDLRCRRRGGCDRRVARRRADDGRPPGFSEVQIETDIETDDCMRDYKAPLPRPARRTSRRIQSSSPRAERSPPLIAARSLATQPYRQLASACTAADPCVSVSGRDRLSSASVRLQFDQESRLGAV
jgi:hypothetical protein